LFAKTPIDNYDVDHRGSTATRGFFGNFSPKADRPLRRGYEQVSLCILGRSGKIFRGRAYSRLPV